jgi:hypothetical protein
VERKMNRRTKATTVLAVVIAVLAAVGLADSMAMGASRHPVSASKQPSTAKLQREITALKAHVAKDYLSAAKSKTTFVNGNGAIAQGSVNFPSGAGGPATLLTAPGNGPIQISSSIDSGVQLSIANHTSQTETAIVTKAAMLNGTSETDLAANTTTSIALSPSSAQYTIQILRSTSPLRVDTLTLSEYVPGPGVRFIGQLVHGQT